MTPQTDTTQADAQRSMHDSASNATVPVGYDYAEQWQAALSVMHPEVSDPDWKHYHGAWGG